ncbi:hypothetical protein [Flavobacterium branchiicola]|uniref:Uncharacterized protein n=1 Tax=Flavobacterium branchiicola TaxID=1114875 RepID=A0ABV9PJT7_9FLAO|nr:hypothetical protein [Flavobacterium branchiicola]MBS7256308.1 hypothetical protein [Flavobacterium branchiicola]
MKQIFQNKTIQVLKKALFIGLILFTISFIQICWFMGGFSNRISTGFLDCSFIENVYLMSLSTAAFLTIVLLLLSLGNKMFLESTIKLISLISICFFLNYTILVDGESSWNTYAFKDELVYIFSLSIVPVLVLSIAAAVWINYISKVNHKQN